MSVRRLAEKQPESFAFSNENATWADIQIAKYPEGRQASAVLSLLWRAQKQNDYWLPKPAIEEVARKLDMPYIRVLEVATFYTMFNLEPVGRYFIQMCGTTPCMLQGSDGIKAVLERRVGPQRKVTADGNFSWLEVECLGACCNAPMVQINDDYYEDLTPENFDKLLDDLAGDRPASIGSQIGRRSSEPVGGLTALASLYGEDGRSGPACGSYGSTPAAPLPDTSSAPHSGRQTDERTTQGVPGDKLSDQRTERTEQAAASPSTEEDTGTRRTEPSAASAGTEHEKRTQARTKRAKADTPSDDAQKPKKG